MSLIISLAGLFAAWFLVLTIPGPNFFAVTQYSVSESRKAGIIIAFGVSVGAATWATASLVGISALFENARWLYNSIKIIGGLYLVYMGLMIISKSLKRVKLPKYTIQTVKNGGATFRVGLFTSYSNPKTAAFFGSLFMVSFPLQAPGWFYIVTIGMVFCASLGWYSLLAYVFSMHLIQEVYTKVRNTMDKITGAIFVILGIRLVLTKT